MAAEINTANSPEAQIAERIEYMESTEREEYVEQALRMSILFHRTYYLFLTMLHVTGVYVRRRMSTSERLASSCIRQRRIAYYVLHEM